MTRPQDSLILAFVLLATPALAAKPHATAKTPAPVAAPVSADPAGDLIDQAQAAQGRGEKELALRLGQAAIVADPARTAAYDMVGDLYAADGSTDYARFYYNKALAIDPIDANATKAIAALDHPDGQRAAKADTSSK